MLTRKQFDNKNATNVSNLPLFVVPKPQIQRLLGEKLEAIRTLLPPLTAALLEGAIENHKKIADSLLAPSHKLKPQCQHWNLNTRNSAKLRVPRRNHQGSFIPEIKAILTACDDQVRVS
jgi:hypothetical protein